MRSDTTSLALVFNPSCSRAGRRLLYVSWLLSGLILGLAACSVHAVTYSYDSLNRLTSVVYSPAQRIDYVYDAAGNLIEERVNGSAGLTVTAQASPVAGGTVSILPAQSGYVAGDVVTVTTTPAAGYTFTGWSGVAGCSLAASCTFTLGSTNVALVASYAAPSSLQPLRMIVVPSNGGTQPPWWICGAST